MKMKKKLVTFLELGAVLFKILCSALAGGDRPCRVVRRLARAAREWAGWKDGGGWMWFHSCLFQAHCASSMYSAFDWAFLLSRFSHIFNVQSRKFWGRISLFLLSCCTWIMYAYITWQNKNEYEKNFSLIVTLSNIKIFKKRKGRWPLVPLKNSKCIVILEILDEADKNVKMSSIVSLRVLLKYACYGRDVQPKGFFAVYYCI